VAVMEEEVQEAFGFVSACCMYAAPTRSSAFVSRVRAPSIRPYKAACALGRRNDNQVMSCGGFKKEAYHPLKRV